MDKTEKIKAITAREDKMAREECKNHRDAFLIIFDQRTVPVIARK